MFIKSGNNILNLPDSEIEEIEYNMKNLEIKITMSDLFTTNTGVERYHTYGFESNPEFKIAISRLEASLKGKSNFADIYCD